MRGIAVLTLPLRRLKLFGQQSIALFLEVHQQLLLLRLPLQLLPLQPGAMGRSTPNCLIRKGFSARRRSLVGEEEHRE